jgi:hypothetical protein
MEYQVPQFIEVEDKLVGPLTLKQFIYLAGGAGICAVLFVSLPTIFAVLLSLPVAGLAGALSFYKVNGKSFVEVLEAGFNYYTGAKFFLWKHREAEKGEGSPMATQAPEAERPVVGGPRLTSGKLSELAWSLDIQRSSPGEKDQ